VLSNDASPFSRQYCLTAGTTWFFDKSTEFELLVKVLVDWVQHANAANPEGASP